MNVFASILKFFGLLKPSKEQTVKSGVPKEIQHDAQPPISVNRSIPKPNQHIPNSNINTSYHQPTETNNSSIIQPKSLNNFDSISLYEFINKYESTFKINQPIILSNENKELRSILNSTTDSEGTKQQRYEIYVICPGCHIGGYMGCPDCSGAGGWYETRYGIPTDNEIQKRSEIQKISDNINRAANITQWNSKLIKYVDESLDVLKNIASEPGAKELISKIERLKKEVNIRTLKDKIIKKYDNIIDLEISIANNNIFYAKGTLFKYSYNKFIIRSSQNELYDLPLNLFKDFLTKIIKSCSVMKTYNTYKFINKDIEDDLLKNSNKGFAVILLKFENATHYFYVSHKIINKLTQNIIEDKSLIKHIN